ncbi:MAG TPA: NAD(P)/FAD-dependent oxidoreductase [Candidatus Bathyarchaeia archaeon]|jgi:2-polyprenyl-6-methoxyphenol hydroxylase-like FAD-dependent oxidoreductase|nr:NAD(P)/FAD-dependent oxidoreductase [Candidatus Bathyarchaeia archaeon]
MSTPTYDIVTIGGGIAAASLAKVMAERGARALVLEKEQRFIDRIRGEGIVPWGVAEARELGILELLRAACGQDVPLVEGGMGPRDLVSTTLQRLPALSFAHQEMQETLLDAAEAAGAEVRRGVTVERVEPGLPATVVTRGNSHERILARLVVAADGRGSASRKWGSFTVREQSNDYYMAGVLLTDVRSSSDLIYFVFNPEFGMCIGLVPLGKNRHRAYFMYPKTMGYRLQGDQMLSLFISESARCYPLLAELYAGAKSIGPLASFDVSDYWVDHPYREGVVLIGDAAATTDPTFGQGLSLALRDARVLRDELSRDSDWAAAANRYAEQHRQYCNACYAIEGWLRTLFQDPSPEAAALRQRAMPLIAQDPTRVPDNLFSGPDLPLDDQVRARLFGER